MVVGILKDCGSVSGVADEVPAREFDVRNLTQCDFAVAIVRHAGEGNRGGIAIVSAIGIEVAFARKEVERRDLIVQPFFVFVGLVEAIEVVVVGEEAIGNRRLNSHNRRGNQIIMIISAVIRLDGLGVSIHRSSYFLVESEGLIHNVGIDGCVASPIRSASIDTKISLTASFYSSQIASYTINSEMFSLACTNTNTVVIVNTVQPCIA